MLTRLAPWKRARPEPQPEEIEPETPEPVVPRFLLLTPEGSFTFKLLTFDAIESVRAYAQANVGVLPSGDTVAFQALHDKSDAPEVAVMVRDGSRPDLVQLYSFVDMEAARSFIRDATAGGLDLGRVLIYWAARVPLEEYLRSATRPSPPRPSAATGARPPGRAHPVAQPQRRTRSERSGADFVPGAPKAQGPETAQEVAREAAPPSSEPDLSDERRASPIGRFFASVNAWEGWNSLGVLIAGAALFKAEVYDDLTRDRAATGRATLVLGLGSLAAAIGSVGSGPVSIVAHAMAAPLGWAVYVGSVYIVGTWLIGARRPSFLRVYQAAGLGSAPALLLVLGLIPLYGTLLVLAASLWVAAAVAVALTFVLELTRESTVVVTVVGWCLYFAISQMAPLALA